MSKIALTPNGSGSGVFTIASPNSNTNRTITLPDESVTLGAGTPSIDDNGNATAITIDSSENVLVGKTATDLDVTGSALFNTGQAYHTRSGNTALYLNRLSSDGTIADFRKDGTTVGSIGTYLNASYMMGSSSKGIFLNGNLNPSGAGGAIDDNTQNIGASNRRWKDAYLSGGVYLGGTGAANKLEDYEEGTWTPTLPNGGTVGTNIASTYTKVGNLVTAYCNVLLQPTNNSSTFNVGGLPFIGLSGNHGGGSISYAGAMDVRHWSAPLETSNLVYFHRADASADTIRNSEFGGASRQFIMQIIYITA